MRKLKHHEQKLLRKVDFVSWHKGANVREIKVMRRFHIQKREEYTMYSRLCGSVLSLANRLAKLSEKDPFREKYEGLLLSKLYDMGILDASSTVEDLKEGKKVTVSAYCRRRLAVVACKLKLAHTVKMATQLIEQGHIRVGPDTITDPAFLVTRNMEDFVTWVDTSKMKQHVMDYNDERDDFMLL